MNFGTMARISAALFSIWFTAGLLDAQEGIRIRMSQHVFYRTVN
jgi:hypothetical protein